jgi:dihydroxyacetone kinase-like protein
MASKSEASLSRKVAAEFLGTAALVICGPGTATATLMIAKSSGAAFSMAELGIIAFAFMMVITAMIYTIGHISGCHINPAVTLALAAAKKARWSEVPGYLGAQLLGATTGAFAIWSILGQPAADAGLGTLSYTPGNAGHAFSAELIGTFLLVLVVFGTATDSRATPGWYGLAIPAIVFAMITVAGPVSGAALNPARYLGPMIATATLNTGNPVPWNQAPLYLTATFTAALLAAGAYAFIGGVDPVLTPRRRDRPTAGRQPGPAPVVLTTPATAPRPAKAKPRRSPAAHARPNGLQADTQMFLLWIHGAAQLVVDNAHYLTHLDAVIGDADHGINMKRGFQAALVSLDASVPTTPGMVLATAGRAFLSDLGGAAGPLYGTGFLEAAQALGDDVEISPAQLGAALQAALAGVQQLGAATPGDKTMVDALAPAVDAYQAVVRTGGTLAEATRSAADAALWGLRASVAMQARKGRASYIGERTIGNEDPGAASTVLIFQALAAAAAGDETAKVPAGWRR